MNISKSRKQSNLLRALKILDKRMKLSNEDSQYLYSLEKGFEGEEVFDSYVKKYLSGECLVLNDLLLTISNTTIQLDSVIITSDTVYVYEIKNYKGDYQVSSGRLLTISGKEINHPLTQLNRSLAKLRQLLTDWDITLRVKGAIIFVDPSFYLFNVDHSDNYVFPTQIDSYFSTIQSKLKKLSKTQQYLARKLVNEQITSAPYQKQVPTYKYEGLKKGFSCPQCGEIDLSYTQRFSRCEKCQTRHSKVAIIKYNCEEFRFLFPDKKVTCSVMHDWSGQNISEYQIRRTLAHYYERIGTTSNTYYESKENE